MKQDTVLQNDGVNSEEHVYTESYSIQQTPSDTSVLNLDMLSVTQEEENVCKSCDNVQQLPSSENFCQFVLPDMKEEESSLPVLSSSPTDDAEEVFMPVNFSQVKYVVVFATSIRSAFTVTLFQHYVIAVLSYL
jgi:hypothetical protein